jgi:PAS domain S-box-containing protein
MKRKVKILILDEQPGLAGLLKNELQKDGIQFEDRQVATGMEFAAQLRSFAPDLILVRHSMPGCDGMAALAARQRERSHVPFIFICAAAEVDTALRALREGATDYVFQGWVEQLAFAVRRALREAEERNDRQRAAAALEEMEERYRALFDRSLDCLYVHDFDGRFLDANPAALALLGYTREEIPSVNFQSLLSEDQLPKATQCLEEVRRTGTQRHSIEFNLKHKNGGLVVVDVKGSLILRQGKPFAIQGIAREITNRKQAELELRRMNRLYAVLSQVNQILIRARTPEELLQQVCSIAVEHGGFQSARICRVDPESRQAAPVASAGGPENIIGMVPIYADDRPEAQVPTGIALREGKISIFNDLLADPRSLPWRKPAELSGVKAVASFPIRFCGNLFGALSLYVGEKDVFQEKEVALLSGVAEAISSGLDRLEKEKLEAQLLRSQRTESIGTLASGIAHDLNNVLTPIMMSCQLLSSYAMEDERKQWIEIISRSAQRGSDLVKQVLAFCRGAEGRRMELQAKSVISDIHQFAQQTFPKSISIQIKMREDLWSILADPTQLHQVLLNLCVNARDAMPNGGVLTIEAENVLLDSLQTNASRDDRPRPHLMIAVADTGMGIPPEIREKIFDPFFTTKELGKGTGLGLSTSLGIVKSHGGFINVYSEPRVGTVFKVYIPALGVSHEASLKTDEEQLPRGHGELILLVDDEAAVRTITEQTLQAYGYKVITACDGAEAVEMYARHGEKVAVILMDMMMPVMDGPATVHTLSRRNQNLKIIAASGLSSEAHMAKAPNDAVKAFLPKPYVAETLLQTIHQVLARESKVASPNPAELRPKKEQ